MSESEEATTSKNTSNNKTAQIVQVDQDIQNSSDNQNVQDAQMHSDNQDDDFLTPELQEMYKKLDRRMKERYQRCKTDEAKIALLEGIMHERKKGVSVLEIIHIFIDYFIYFFFTKPD
ncbi:3182_t:CDS:1 [Racocetra fulgida]|uniref:3182_t:CDS:1 n=1 Tax=Racocetra fulgida TaxID=60492 RepID=A0A9N9GCI9_9GLOM|nr:3182_t:CDS:1 [Racocetra fulgida]